MDTEISSYSTGQPLGQQCDVQGRARSPAAVYPLLPVQPQEIARPRDIDRPLGGAHLQELAHRLKQESSQAPSLHQVPAFPLDYGQVCVLGSWMYPLYTIIGQRRAIRWKYFS